MLHVLCSMAMGLIQKYKIKNRVQETHNIFLLDLEPENGEVFEFLCGQFVMLHIFNEDGSVWRKLPYSLATSPLTRDYIQLGIKVYGEFSQKASTLCEGETVGITGPFGKFIFDEHIMSNLIMLAGGVGITPFMSTIRYAGHKQLPNNIILLYANQFLHDIAYRNELQKLESQNENFKIIYTLDHISAGWKGEEGFITSTMLQEFCEPLKGKYFFLCGPPPFVEGMQRLLSENDIKQEFIKTEKF